MSDAIKIGQRFKVTGSVDIDLSCTSGIIRSIGENSVIIEFDEGSRISADFSDIVPVGPPDNARTAHELVKDFVDDWPEFGTDEPLNGSDMIEYMGGFYAEAKTAL